MDDLPGLVSLCVQRFEVDEFAELLGCVLIVVGKV